MKFTAETVVVLAMSSTLQLLTTNWWPFGYNRAGNGSYLTLSVTNAGPIRFYRTTVRMP